MASNRRAFIWICLWISLFFIPSGIILKMTNDNLNRSVVTVADYYDFVEAAKRSGINEDKIMKDLLDRNCKTIALKGKSTDKSSKK